MLTILEFAHLMAVKLSLLLLLDHNDNVIAETGTDKDYITCEDVLANDGNTFRVKAKHWATGNNCWGTVTIEDKIKPEIYCKM